MANNIIFFILFGVKSSSQILLSKWNLIIVFMPFWKMAYSYKCTDLSFYVFIWLSARLQKLLIPTCRLCTSVTWLYFTCLSPHNNNKNTIDLLSIWWNIIYLLIKPILILFLNRPYKYLNTFRVYPFLYLNFWKLLFPAPVGGFNLTGLFHSALKNNLK